MDFTIQDRDRLINFLGYGNPAGRFWFVGMEEGTGGNDHSLAQNITVRLSFPTNVMDMAEAHNDQHLGQIPSDEGKLWDFRTGKLPSVWIYMARFVRALQGAEDWTDKEQAKTYVREKLGRTGGDTFVTELLPLPKRAAGMWPPLYQNWYASRELYETEVLPMRKQSLRRLLQTHQPSYVFCYGGVHHPHYKDVFQTDYSPLVEKKISVGRMGQTHIVLLPFMGNGRIGKKDVEKVVDYLKRS
jgi:hypothetical protein